MILRPRSREKGIRAVELLEQATALLPASSLGAADPEPEATPAQA